MVIEINRNDQQIVSSQRISRGSRFSSESQLPSMTSNIFWVFCCGWDS